MSKINVIAAKIPGYYNASGYLEKGSGDTINVPNAGVEIDGQGLIIEAQTNLDPLTNNDGSFAAFALGTDYYLYACQPGPHAISAKLVFSVNSTYPTGYTADNSRKIGGFHYGRVRAVDANGTPIDSVNGAYGTGWEDDVSSAIVPNSIWDLKNRPICSPEGMVKVGRIWVDIYLASQDTTISLSTGKLAGGTCKSAYNATPLTGTEDLNWYHFNELAKRTGKRLLSLAEWCQAAEGSPQGNDADNDNAWTMTTNTARNPTGAVVRAVSAYNLCDCVGNVWEWLDGFIVRWDDTGAAGQAWAWRDPMTGQGVGQLYMYDELALVVMLAGGHWGSGVGAGSRCVVLYHSPWDVLTSIGCRLACDAL